MSEGFSLMEKPAPVGDGLSDCPQLPEEIYYDQQKEKYMVCNEGRWEPYAEKALIRELKIRYPERERHLDRILAHIHKYKRLDYCGELAGYRAGYYTEHGRHLITRGPKLVEPREGDWSVIHQIIENALPPDEAGKSQAASFHAWMKSGLECIRKGEEGFCPALVLVGPKGAGKSVLQDEVISELLGGRVANPAPYFQGRSEFTGDLATAEHLCIEDASGFKSTQDSRDIFGARIKEFVANRTRTYHPKHKQQFTAKTIQRISISVNQEPKNISALPPYDGDDDEGSVSDKIMALWVTKKPMPMPTGSTDEYERFLEKVRSEVPAYAHYLLNSPYAEGCFGHRGVAPYWHPQVIGSLRKISKEADLGDLLECAYYQLAEAAGALDPRGNPPETIELSAAQIFATLQGFHTPGSTTARAMFRSTFSLGTLLGNLAKERDSRVAHGGHRKWIIRRHPLHHANRPF